MNSLPSSHVLSIRPKNYLKQGFSHCGVYSVKAILEAYNLDNKNHPKEYHPRWIGRLTGTTMGPNYYSNIFRSHGLQALLKTARNKQDSEKIELLKTLLSKNSPAMIRIGNGYATNVYNPLIGKVMPHWITLWGYDDEKQFFYVYDSGLPLRYRTKNLPIGNTTRTYKEILRDWNFGISQFWLWPLTGIESYRYIEIEKKL